MLDEALNMLKQLKAGDEVPNDEIQEMVDDLQSRGKELERECELSNLEAYEMKECWRIAGELEDFIEVDIEG
jgi:uncharacterized protein YaaR (DUF327 family)